MLHQKMNSIKVLVFVFYFAWKKVGVQGERPACDISKNHSMQCGAVTEVFDEIGLTLYPYMHECEWPVIACDNGTVTKFTMPRMFFSGSLSTKIGLLSNLERLEISSEKNC